MLLQMVGSSEPPCCRTLMLRVAIPNSWPLMTPIMLPRLPRGSPVRQETTNSDTYYPPLSLWAKVLSLLLFHQLETEAQEGTKA